MWRERLTAPGSWWLLGFGFVGTVVWIVWVVAPGAPAVVAGAVAAAVAVAALVRLGSTVVAVHVDSTGGVLVAGRARLPTAVVAKVTPLDAAALHRAAGVDADARAFLVLPPFVRTAVKVDLADPSDPTPYWLVATRHPQRLAAALTSTLPGNLPGNLPAVCPAPPPRASDAVTD